MANVEFTTEELLSERWLPVVDGGGNYSVSDLGRVRRDTPARGAIVGRITMGAYGGSGYLQTSINTAEDRRTESVHRIVFETFVRPLRDGEDINHLDGVKVNNRLANLEATTRSGNMRHAYATGLCGVGERSPTSTISAATAVRICRLYHERVPNNIIAAALRTTPAIVNQVARGKSWRHVTGLPPHNVRHGSHPPAS